MTKERLEELKGQLKAWQDESSTSFSSKLFSLICKADLSNRAKLRTAFPDEVEAFEMWHRGDKEMEGV